jgi:hypothetical protein
MRLFGRITSLRSILCKHCSGRVSELQQKVSLELGMN